MAQLLMTLKGNKYVNHSMFRPYLYIYDDIILYRKRRRVFWIDEITTTYTHIVQVNLHKGIWFAKLEIINPGTEDIEIKGIWNKPAKRAKKIMDQKINQVHNRDHHANDQQEKQQITNVEKSIQRLKELHTKGAISDKEYKKRREQLLKNIK